MSMDEAARRVSLGSSRHRWLLLLFVAVAALAGSESGRAFPAAEIDEATDEPQLALDEETQERLLEAHAEAKERLQSMRDRFAAAGASSENLKRLDHQIAVVEAAEEAVR